MKGLLLKDFYMVWKHFKLFFLMMLFFVAVSFFGNDNAFFAAFPTMMTGTIPITLLAYDERSGWTKYCGALPYSTAQIVSEKYLIGLILQTAAMAAGVIILFVRGFFLTYSTYEIQETITMIGGVFITSLILPTVCLPFSLKYGTEKGRMIFYLIIAAMAVVIMIGMDIGLNFLVNNKNVAYIYALGIPVCYVLSWLISISICKNKESGK